MTVGDRIRYLRNSMGITQDTLAKISGVHPVSIRKYEINKAQPKQAQLLKLAEALHVSSFAIAGENASRVKLETVGDFMGILFFLCNSGILEIQGKRDSDHMLRIDTVMIHFNPILNAFLEMGVSSEGEQSFVALQDVLVRLKKPRLLVDLLTWEKANYLYQNAKKTVEEDPTEDNQNALENLAEIKEKVELELQKSQMLLDNTGGVQVRIPPSFR